MSDHGQGYGGLDAQPGAPDINAIPPTGQSEPTSEQETAAILADPDTMAAIAEGETDLAAGRVQGRQNSRQNSALVERVAEAIHKARVVRTGSGPTWAEASTGSNYGPSVRGHARAALREISTWANERQDTYRETCGDVIDLLHEEALRGD